MHQTASGQALTRRQRNRALFALISSTTIALTGQFLISPILVFQLNLQGLSPAQIGLFTSASWLGIFLGSPFTARISAWLGVRPVLILSSLVPLSGLVGIMLTNSVLIWLALYFYIGIGSALRWIVGEALIADLAPDAWRGRIVGAFQMLLGGAFVVAPALLAWLGPTNPGAPWLSLALIAIGLGLTLLMPAIDSIHDSEQAVGPRALLSVLPRSWPVVTAGFVGGFFELGISSVLPVYGMAIGLSAALSALLIAVSGIGSSLIMLPVGMAADRIAPSRLMQVCVLAIVVSSLTLPAATEYDWIAWFACLTWGAAGGALYTLTMIRIGREQRGPALINTTSILVLSYTLGGLAGPMLSGMAMEISVRWALAALYLVISIVALAVFSRSRP